MGFSGRDREIKLLEENFKSSSAGLVAIYGRRRIGKSQLIKHYFNGKRTLFFEGLEKKRTSEQILHFKNQLFDQTQDPILKEMVPTRWETVFDYITHYLTREKVKLAIAFDEFQWMAAGQTTLVSLLKYYWDNKWKDFSVQLILCGSISSYMVGKVIRSKALYGRIDLQINVCELPPIHAKEILGKQLSYGDALKYQLIFGGVPKYLELISRKYGLETNIENLCFKQDSFFTNEFERIFYSQFKRHRMHEKIVSLIAKRPLTLKEISEAIEMVSSGGITRYLDELVDAGFIMLSPRSIIGKKEKRYRLSDEFLRFYFHFIKPNQKLISSGAQKSIFRNKVLPKWNSWLGLSFESFCIKKIKIIAELLKVGDTIADFGPIMLKGELGVQFDLAITTSDNTLYLCESKFHISPIGLEVISDFERKIKRANFPSKYSLKRVLISSEGATKDLVKSEYFDVIISAEDFFKPLAS